MSPLTAPGVTGQIDQREWFALYRYWLDDEPTGHEYGLAVGYRMFVSHFWGLESEGEGTRDDPEAPFDEDLRDRAASLAATRPHVAVSPPARARLTGNLAEDVRSACGLTLRQIADVFGISERAVAGWRAQGVPGYRVETMEALRAIGAILVGGMGPEGVRAWLTGGQPSRVERLRDGELEAVVAEASAYVDTPAT